MNNKLIRQYGQDMLCYRIRTARQRKRAQYKDFDKKLIALYDEEITLWNQHNALGWEPLIPPIQRGWKRYFILREDVERSRYAAFFQGILDKINTVQRSHRKSFTVKKRKYGRKIQVVKGQELLKPDEYLFSRMNFSAAEQRFFYATYHFEKKSKTVKRYIFSEPWRFVLVVRPNIIDKVRIQDSGLESKLKQVDNYMERNNYRGRQEKLLWGHKRNWRGWKAYEKYNESNPYKNKTLLEILEMIKY